MGNNVSLKSNGFSDNYFVKTNKKVILLGNDCIKRYL